MPHQQKEKKVLEKVRNLVIVKYTETSKFHYEIDRFFLSLSFDDVIVRISL